MTAYLDELLDDGDERLRGTGPAADVLGDERLLGVVRDVTTKEQTSCDSVHSKQTPRGLVRPSNELTASDAIRLHWTEHTWWSRFPHGFRTPKVTVHDRLLDVLDRLGLLLDHLLLFLVLFGRLGAVLIYGHTRS